MEAVLKENTANEQSPGMATNTARQSVYGNKEKLRAEAILKANRTIRAAECKARAKRFIYGRKQLLRLNAVLEATRYIEIATAVSNLLVDEETETKPNHVTTTMPWMFCISVLVLYTALSFAYKNACHCLSTCV